MNDILAKLAAFTRKREGGLLPCPYCGTQQRFTAQTSGRGLWVVMCENHDCSVRIGASSKDKATKRWNNRIQEAALIALVQDAAREIERLRKLAAESRDTLDAAIPCIGRDSTSFSTQYALRQAKEQRDRCEQSLNPQEAT